MGAAAGTTERGKYLASFLGLNLGIYLRLWPCAAIFKRRLTLDRVSTIDPNNCSQYNTLSDIPPLSRCSLYWEIVALVCSSTYLRPAVSRWLVSALEK